MSKKRNLDIVNDLSVTERMVTDGGLIGHDDKKDYLVAFEQVEIAPGQRVVIRTPPMSLHFHATRLIVAREGAMDFDLEDLRVEDKPQFRLQQAIPAVCFTEDANVNLQCDYSHPNNVITIAVRNIGRESHVFKAAVVGTPLWAENHHFGQD